MHKNEDILGNLDMLFEQDQKVESYEDTPISGDDVCIQEESDIVIYEHIEEISPEEKNHEYTKEVETLNRSSILGGVMFIVKYISTSVTIFAVLLVAANYSAYWNIAYSFFYAEEMEHTKNSLIESVAAASIDDEKTEKNTEQDEVDTFKQLSNNELKHTPSMHSLSQLVGENTKNVNLGIEITPYENRIVIPKIGKNIPLIDIKQKKVSGVDELNNIFMDELENGVIRYPGSAKPGEDGNAFIFGHSSNFPWMEGEYNDVFALLDKVVFDDEVVVYYGQEKYVYKIRTKNVIKPGDVSVLKNDENDKSQITLMTCWPIGTTLNRLILTGDLISVE